MPSMPPNAVMKSAKNPPGPVTCSVIPAAPSVAAPESRRAWATP